MVDGWHLQDQARTLTGREAADLVRDRVHRGDFTTWFESELGRVLAVVSNGARAMVMVLDEPGDAGAHATDPAATGAQDGYVLDDGQHDTYDNRDTVNIADAFTIVEHIVDHGHPPAHVAWHIDR